MPKDVSQGNANYLEPIAAPFTLGVFPFFSLVFGEGQARTA